MLCGCVNVVWCVRALARYIMRGEHLRHLLGSSSAFLVQARSWLGGGVIHIVLQLQGGVGCPLIALVNALALAGALRLPEPGVYAFEELTALVQTHIDRRTAALVAAQGAAPPPGLLEATALLARRAQGAPAALRTFRGLELDVAPADAQAHSESAATRVYEAAGVRLLHGAVLPPGSAAARAFGAKSELFAESGAFEDPGSPDNQLILEWLQKRPSGGGNLFLTPAGLASIRAALHPHQAAVAYLNDRAFRGVRRRGGAQRARAHARACAQLLTPHFFPPRRNPRRLHHRAAPQ